MSITYWYQNISSVTLQQIQVIQIYIRKQQKMTDKEIDKTLQLPPTNHLYADVSWISKKVDYSKIPYNQIQAENQKILNTLKIIQNKLGAQLQQKKSVPKKIPQTENIKALDSKIKNNEKLIAALKKDSQVADQRKVIINQGLQSKTIQTKFALQHSINKLKSEIRQLKLQQHQITKRFQTVNDVSKPFNHDETSRLEEQLRAMSIKYVRLLDKYNKSTQKLALVSKTQLPQFTVPEDIYDKQLEERQQAQFKQYQGIVKLCTVLSHRNDSQHNKAHRQYTLKLKQLQRTVMKLGELDQAITSREGQLIQSKKNVQLFKMKLTSQQNIDTRVMRLSQGSIPSISRKTRSNSTVHLINTNQKLDSIKKQQKTQSNKLRNRGNSLSRIQAV